MLSVLISIVSCDTYSNTETASFYTFDCQTGFVLDYLPINLTLKIRSTTQSLSATKKNMIKNTEEKFDLGNPSKVSDYYVYKPKVSGNDPLQLNFTCDSGVAAISPITEQKVPSAGLNDVFAIISIIFVVICIGIIGIQFLTFHKKKVD